MLVNQSMGDKDVENLCYVMLCYFILNIRKQADSAPLMTRAMREVREESEMYKYDKVSTY